MCVCVYRKVVFVHVFVTWTAHALRIVKAREEQTWAPRTWRGFRADRLHSLLYSGRASTNTNPTGDTKQEYTNTTST